jgi:3-oxoacyl-[acyl-carrier-protein] synthase III
MDSRAYRDSRTTSHYKRRRYHYLNGSKAAEIAIERAGIAKTILILLFCYLSPDYFPGPGVLVQRDLGLKQLVR